MKAFFTLLVSFGMTSSTSALAKGPPSQATEKQAAEEIRKAMHSAISNQQAPPGHSKRPVDPDQGDDNAALRAITIVCSKNTPAAQRSAICPVPVSPE